jgi:hypothetical protein
MKFINLNMLSGFMQDLHITMKHYTKHGHFSRHTIFSTIYLLQEHKLSHKNHFQQEINMSNFVQAKEDDMNMNTKIQY